MCEHSLSPALLSSSCEAPLRLLLPHPPTHYLLSRQPKYGHLCWCKIVSLVEDGDQKGKNVKLKRGKKTSKLGSAKGACAENKRRTRGGFTGRGMSFLLISRNGASGISEVVPGSHSCTTEISHPGKGIFPLKQ